MRHRHRNPDASLALAVGLIVAFVVALAIAVTAEAKPRETLYQRAQRIVYAVFPDSTQEAAMRVVGCETGYTYSEWSYNPSGASGYFQVLQGNAGRVLRYDRSWPGGRQYGGQMLIIPRGIRLFLPWTNARVALFLSKGGTDWGEWACKP